MHDLPRTLRTTSASELKERVEAARRNAPFVLYRDGDGCQRIVMLDGPPRLTIGRQEASDIALAWDAAASRVHANLERVGEEWTLVDDGSSRNGSFVNGETIRGRRRLRDGDILRIGFTTFAFVVPSERESSSETVATTVANVPALTAAQRRVLVALCRPLVEGPFGSASSNQQIAGELFLGVATVKSHMQGLFEAFGVRDLAQNQKRAELARLALKRGVVTEDELLAGGSHAVEQDQRR
ncbi:MAG TPA: FHA domain-containing protein [Solirubrobacteraceae bacterium]|jgi:pSer/pThr/pTyr-binding forkhead associated (FHA) protein|nr:FHA domain-containing protein [Solirubrobacteraceae bacterium]